MSTAAATTLPISSISQPTLAVDWSRTLGTLLLAAITVVPHFPLRGNNPEQFGTVDAQLLLRLGVCFLCGVYGLAYGSIRWETLGKFPLAWMVLIGLWAIVTIPLSLGPVQATAAVGVFWCALLFVPAVLEKLGLIRVLQTILAGCTIYILGQWVLWFTVPELGRGVELLAGADPIYRLGLDSQQLGLQAAVLIGLAFILRLRGALSATKLWLLLALAIVTLIGAKSRTSATAAIVGAALIGLRQLDARRLAMLIGIGAAAVGLALFLLASGIASIDLNSAAASVSRSGSAEEITTVTGRSEIWSYVLEKIEESPLIGCGYGCTTFALQDFALVPLRHAHNEILNSMLCLGVLGAILVIGMFLQQIAAACTVRDEFQLLVTSVTIIAGLTEPVLLLTMPPVLMILWIAALCRVSLDSPPNTSRQLCG